MAAKQFVVIIMSAFIAVVVFACTTAYKNQDKTASIVEDTSQLKKDCDKRDKRLDSLNQQGRDVELQQTEIKKKLKRLENSITNDK